MGLGGMRGVVGRDRFRERFMWDVLTGWENSPPGIIGLRGVIGLD